MPRPRGLVNKGKKRDAYIHLEEKKKEEEEVRERLGELVWMIYTRSSFLLLLPPSLAYAYK
jgi:hypothetical protein